MKEECLICKAPLEYLETDELMECAICHKRENSKTRCINGHYVCNDCHTKGMDTIIGLCLAETSKNPIEIITKSISVWRWRDLPSSVNTLPRIISASGEGVRSQKRIIQ